MLCFWCVYNTQFLCVQRYVICYMGAKVVARNFCFIIIDELFAFGVVLISEIVFLS